MKLYHVLKGTPGIAIRMKDFMDGTLDSAKQVETTREHHFDTYYFDPVAVHNGQFREDTPLNLTIRNLATAGKAAYFAEGKRTKEPWLLIVDYGDVDVMC